MTLNWKSALALGTVIVLAIILADVLQRWNAARQLKAQAAAAAAAAPPAAQ